MRVAIQVIHCYELDVPKQHEGAAIAWANTLSTTAIADLGSLKNVETDYAEVVDDTPGEE